MMMMMMMIMMIMMSTGHFLQKAQIYYENHEKARNAVDVVSENRKIIFSLLIYVFEKINKLKHVGLNPLYH